MQILSAIQYKPRFATCRADVRDNFRRCEGLIHTAWKLGSQVVVFPELTFTGYSHMSPDEASRVAEKDDGPTFQAMRGVALALKAYVVWGYVEAGPDGSLYNAASMVGPNGTRLTGYRKVNLWGNDFLWAKPGEDAAPVVTTEFGQTSIVVCRDLRDKIPDNIPRTASTKLFDGQKMDLVAALVNWGKGGFPSTSWMDFAANNRCTAVIANRWGTEERSDVGDYSLDFGHGGSIVIERDWTVHTGGLQFSRDCVVTAAIGE